jgi:hypothetical protein
MCWISYKIYCTVSLRDGSMSSAKNVNGLNESSMHLFWTVSSFSIISVPCKREAAFTNCCFK